MPSYFYEADEKCHHVSFLTYMISFLHFPLLSMVLVAILPAAENARVSTRVLPIQEVLGYWSASRHFAQAHYYIRKKTHWLRAASRVSSQGLARRQGTLPPLAMPIGWLYAYFHNFYLYNIIFLQLATSSRVKNWPKIRAYGFRRAVSRFHAQAVKVNTAPRDAQHI